MHRVLLAALPVAACGSAEPAPEPTPSAAPVPAPEAARRVRYGIGADGKVTSIHAGGPSIAYGEGCA